MKKVLEENETLTQIVNNETENGFHQSLSQNFLRKIWLTKVCVTVLFYSIFNMSA